MLREADGELEVLMMRRGAQLAFMAGMWVFPGGRVDPADASAAAHARLSVQSLAVCRERLHSHEGAPLADDAAIALHVAACRETFEEAGVLLARDAAGQPCAPARVAALQPRREEITRNAAASSSCLRPRTFTWTSHRWCTGPTGSRHRSSPGASIRASSPSRYRRARR